MQLDILRNSREGGDTEPHRTLCCRSCQDIQRKWRVVSPATSRASLLLVKKIPKSQRSVISLRIHVDEVGMLGSDSASELLPSPQLCPLSSPLPLTCVCKSSCSWRDGASEPEPHTQRDFYARYSRMAFVRYLSFASFEPRIFISIFWKIFTLTLFQILWERHCS